MCQWFLIQEVNGNVTLSKCEHPAAILIVVRDLGGDVYLLYTCLGCAAEVEQTPEYKILLSRELNAIPFNGELEVTTL